MTDPDRLVAVWKELRATGTTHWPLQAVEFELIRDATTRVFASVAAVGYNETVADRGRRGGVRRVHPHGPRLR